MVGQGLLSWAWRKVVELLPQVEWRMWSWSQEKVLLAELVLRSQSQMLEGEGGYQEEDLGDGLQLGGLEDGLQGDHGQ